MHNALHHRHQDSEDGFTLIELMVVVLIIGILLAIAIPTFLGARDRANDRSAQSNLRNALTAEKVLYTDSQIYTATNAAGVTALTGVEPSLTWNAAVSNTTPRQVVALTFPAASTTPSVVVVYDKSQTGTCWYIGDSAAPANNPGVYYMKDSACAAPSDPSAATVTPGSTTGGVANATWASAF